MKIGFVIDDSMDSNDGVQQYVRTLGAWLRNNGHEVHYLAGQSKENANIHSLAKNIHVKFNFRYQVNIFVNF
jgi:phosphatidyl-myo-inositol alpha-mannosyltransferase